jgi:hypothetical protein
VFDATAAVALAGPEAAAEADDAAAAVHAAATVAAAIALAPIRARRLPRFPAPMPFTPFYNWIILIAASSSNEDIASRSGVASRR